MILPFVANETERLVDLIEVTAPVEAARPSNMLISLIPMLIGILMLALVIICLIRVSRYFLTAGNEQKLMRIEMGKLAEEVHLLRQELKGGKNSNSSPQTE